DGIRDLIVTGVQTCALPISDPLIPAHYRADDLSGKVEDKKALLKKFGLDASHMDWPLLAMISRIDVQKGFDLVVSILDYLLASRSEERRVGKECRCRWGVCS